MSPGRTSPSSSGAVASGTLSASRVADVLLAVADAQHMIGVSQLARQLGLSKAVVHRIVRSLVDRELLALSARGEYSLGPGAVRLGARALGSFDLRIAAMPILRELQEQTGETTTVSALVGGYRIYLDQVVSFQEIRMTVELGAPCPLHAGGSGKAILAYAPADLREAVLSGQLRSHTKSTITDRAALEAALDRVRERGAAVSLGERQAGAASVASPILGLEGTAIGAISVCGPRDRLDQPALEAMTDSVIDAARRVTEKVLRVRSGGNGTDGH